MDELFRLIKLFYFSGETILLSTKCFLLNCHSVRTLLLPKIKILLDSLDAAADLHGHLQI